MSGKALMNGLRLQEMDASDMMDVIHYMFEEDLFVATKEEAEHKSEVRTTIYRNLYEREYRSRLPKSSSGSHGSTYADGSPIGPPENDWSDITEFNPDPIRREKKPYIPPSNFNPDAVLPFGKDLDAPLG